MDHARMIVKIQRPLHGTTLLLIYGQDRRAFTRQVAPDELRGSALPDDDKTFWRVSVRRDVITLLERLPEQGW